MGFGVGVRNSRFALVIEDGVVTHVATDPGMDICDKTSAEAIVRHLTPEGVTLVEEKQLDGNVIAGFLVVAAIIAYNYFENVV